MSSIAEQHAWARGASGAEAAAALGCAHCGLPVPQGLVREGASEQFCCSGCETARRVIRGGGLEGFYSLRERLGAERRPATEVASEFAVFDDPGFLAAHCRDSAGVDGRSRRSVDLLVENIHCAACVWLLERTPSLCPGVEQVRVDLGRGRLHIDWRPDAVSLSQVAGVIGSLGYRAHAARGEERRRIRRREDRAMLVRIGVAGAIAANVMLASLSIYAGGATGIEPAHLTLFRWVCAGLGTLSVFWPGRVFFRGAIGGLRSGRMNMDVPIAVGLAVGLAYGLVNTALGAGEVYFDTLVTLVFLLLLGRWLQRQQQRRATDALERLHSLTPSAATLIGDDGVARTVAVESLAPGAVVEVRPNESTPVDGEVVQGESDMNESFLTGESIPVAVGPGSRALAGAANLTSTIRIRATATGEATRAGRIMRLVDESARERAPIVRLADRISGVFVGVVLALAALTAGVWLAIDPSRAVDNAAALLIVTCPCALGMATPLSVIASLGRAARRGILIKGGEMLEALATPGILLLDKTGTITQGRMAVVRWTGPQELRSRVAALERGCAHPVARALAEMDPGGATLAAEVRHSLGGGVVGEVEGRSVAIGSRAFIERRGAAIPAWLTAFESRCADDGLTPVLIAEDGVAVAAAGLGDPVRDGAAEAVESLRAAGWEVGVLSGDDPRVVARVALALGIEPEHCRGGMSPESKLDAVRAALSGPTRGRRPVVMVGDGVNDAAALAASTVGVAVSGGTEASLDAAGVYLSRDGLAPLVELLSGARRTMQVIRAALAASLVYNVVVVAMAMSGHLSPLVAAVLMPMSSLTVIGVAFRSRTFAPPDKSPA